MAVSYREINYSLRPAKSVERKMLGEAFRRLYPFQRLTDYRYVGFGSIYFADFQLVHRALGLNDMVSMEKNTNVEECFRFNKPYRSIELQFGHSNDILPRLEWNKHTILWLDYDGTLNMDVLADIDTFCAKAGSGSMLVISVNAQAVREPSPEVRKSIAEKVGDFDLDRYRLEELQSLIPSKVPFGTKGSDLRGRTALCRIYANVILNEVRDVLATRNSVLSDTEKLEFKQVIRFHYNDGAQMLTLGGVLVKSADQPLLKAAAFEKLEFCRTENDAYEIKVPCLTAREIRHLNSQLPVQNPEELKAPGVPENDLRVYAEMYRYFPAFSEILFI